METLTALFSLLNPTVVALLLGPYLVLTRRPDDGRGVKARDLEDETVSQNR